MRVIRDKTAADKKMPTDVNSSDPLRGMLDLGEPWSRRIIRSGRRLASERARMSLGELEMKQNVSKTVWINGDDAKNIFSTKLTFWPPISSQIHPNIIHQHHISSRKKPRDREKSYYEYMAKGGFDLVEKWNYESDSNAIWNSQHKKHVLVQNLRRIYVWKKWREQASLAFKN